MKFLDDPPALPAWIAMDLLLHKKLEFPGEWAEDSWSENFGRLAEIVDSFLCPVLPDFPKWVSDFRYPYVRGFTSKVGDEVDIWKGENVTEGTVVSRAAYLLLSGLTWVASFMADEDLIREANQAIGNVKGMERIGKLGYWLRCTHTRFKLGDFVQPDGEEQKYWLSHNLAETALDGRLINLVSTVCPKSLSTRALEKGRARLQKLLKEVLEARQRLCCHCAHVRSENPDRVNVANAIEALRGEIQVPKKQTNELWLGYRPEWDLDYFLDTYRDKVLGEYPEDKFSRL